MLFWAIIGILGVLMAYTGYTLIFPRKKSDPAPVEVPKPEVHVNAKSSLKPQKKSVKPAKTQHKELIDSFKNLQTGIVDFDMKENYFAVCCEDSSIRVYKLKSVVDTKAKYVQGSLNKNQPTAIALSSTGNMIWVGGSQDLQIHHFRVHHSTNKFTLEEEKAFPKKHTLRISSLAYLPTCLVSCGEEQDTNIYIWSHTGELLASHDNKQLKHKRLFLSKDFRFFTIATWLGSARIFEVLKDKKTENFSSIHVIMELGGHSQGLTTIGFSTLSTLAVTCGLDRLVKLWNINVQYQFKESPVLLKSILLESDIPVPSACALTETKLVLACEDSLRIYSLPDLQLLSILDSAHSHRIHKADFHDDVLITCSSEPRVHLWHIN